MNSTGFSPWKTVVAITLVGAMALLVSACDTGSGGSSKKSSEASITALELTIDGTDYTAEIDGTTATVTLFTSGVTGIPETVTVKSVTLSPKATGLAANEVLTLTDGQVTVPITAEDGTKSAYTIIVTALFQVASVAKSSATADQRHHYVLFTIKADSDKGKYKLALTAQGDSAPTAQEMTDGAGVTRTITTTEKRVLLAYPLNSSIATLAENHDVTHVIHDAGGVNVDNSLLRPGSTYVLYGLKDGESTVVLLGVLSTDPYSDETIAGVGFALNAQTLGGTYPYHDDDPVFVVPVVVVEPSSVTYQFVKGADPEKFQFDIVSGRVTGTPQFNTSVMGLTPSEYYSEGGYKDINGGDLFGGYFCLQTTLFTDNDVYRLEGAAVTLFGMTFVAEPN